MGAEVIADLLYLYIHDQPVPPVSRCWFSTARSIRVSQHQNIHLFLQTGDSYILLLLTQGLYDSTTHSVIGPEAVPVTTAVPDPSRFLNAVMSCLFVTLPTA